MNGQNIFDRPSQLAIANRASSSICGCVCIYRRFEIVFHHRVVFITEWSEDRSIIHSPSCEDIGFSVSFFSLLNHHFTTYSLCILISLFDLSCSTFVCSIRFDRTTIHFVYLVRKLLFICIILIPN